jgi:hypothetical protein
MGGVNLTPLYVRGVIFQNGLRKSTKGRKPKTNDDAELSHDILNQLERLDSHARKPSIFAEIVPVKG